MSNSMPNVYVVSFEYERKWQVARVFRFSLCAQRYIDQCVAEEVQDYKESYDADAWVGIENQQADDLAHFTAIAHDSWKVEAIEMDSRQPDAPK